VYAEEEKRMLQKVQFELITAQFTVPVVHFILRAGNEENTEMRLMTKTWSGQRIIAIIDS